MADSQLDVLEERLKKLEDIVFGSADKDAFYPKERHLRKEQNVKRKPPVCVKYLSNSVKACIENLNNFNTKLGKAVSDKKNILSTFHQLPQLKNILDPAYSDNLTLSSSATADIILTDETFICDQAAKLKVIQLMQDSMESEHMRAAPKFGNELQKMSQIHLKQQDQTAELTAEIEDLLATYNSTITLLSKQFLQWDDIITKVELASQRKKPLD